jgi:hypothetical protein
MNTFTKLFALALLAALALGLNETASARSVSLADLKILDSHSAKESYCGVRDVCHVDSRVNLSIKVYVNGVYRGTMAPFGDIYPFINDLPGATTTLYAESTCGNFSWSRTVSGNVRDFHWILYP